MNRREIAAVLGGMLAFILWVAPGMLILTASIRDEPPGLGSGLDQHQKAMTAASATAEA